MVENYFISSGGAAEDRLKERAALVIQAGINRDPVEPGVESGAGLKLAQIAIGLEEGGLRHVSGLGFVPQQVGAEIVDAILIPEDDIPEGRLIAALAALDQLDIVIISRHNNLERSNADFVPCRIIFTWGVGSARQDRSTKKAAPKVRFSSTNAEGNRATSQVPPAF